MHFLLEAFPLALMHDVMRYVIGPVAVLWVSAKLKQSAKSVSAT
jgi:hypothetical protein